MHPVAERKRDVCPQSDRLELATVYTDLASRNSRPVVGRLPRKTSREVVTVPEWENPESLGASASTLRVREWIGSTLPASSVARYSRACMPSWSVKGEAYVCHEPASKRYEIEWTPLVASVVVTVTVALLTYQPAEPEIAST